MFLWRSGWDSNPRRVAPQLISSQSRYDHFDTAPYAAARAAKSIINGLIHQVKAKIIGTAKQRGEIVSPSNFTSFLSGLALKQFTFAPNYTII